jgi:hypothetical protein
MKYYIDCASISIVGSGTSVLDNLPDMFVGDMTLTGHIGPGECRSTSRFALEYPHPGEAKTIVEVQNIPFKKPTTGKCYTKASVTNSTTSASSTSTLSTTISSSATSSTESNIL